MYVTTYNKKTTPMAVFRKSMKNYKGLVPNLLDEISQWLIRKDVQKDKITNVQIVFAEVLNNIIEHGFAGENSGIIDVEIEVSGDTIVIQVNDNGMKYTPPEVTQTPLQDNCDIDSLPEGGFGWFLIREITSSFEFHRDGDRNCLILNFQ